MKDTVILRNLKYKCLIKGIFHLIIKNYYNIVEDLFIKNFFFMEARTLFFSAPFSFHV